MDKLTRQIVALILEELKHYGNIQYNEIAEKIGCSLNDIEQCLPEICSRISDHHDFEVGGIKYVS